MQGGPSLKKSLPNEILTHIATYLKPTDLVNLKLVSQPFLELSHLEFDIAWQPCLEKLKEIDPNISFIPRKEKTLQIQLKEHCMRIAQEQFEEIKLLQNSWKDRRVIAAMLESELRKISEPAKTFGEIYEREQLLNQFNAQLIKSECQRSQTFLKISQMGLTRFPKELFKDVELASYWAKLTHLVLSNNLIKCLPDELAMCTKLQVFDCNSNKLTALPDQIRVRYTEKWYTQTMASQKNLFLTNMRKQIKASQNYFNARLIETLKAPSDHPVKVGLLSSILCAVASMSLFSSSGLLAPSILLGGLVTMGIKTKNHFTNKALHRAEQQPNSDSAAAPLSAGEKRDSNWYQYAQGLFTPVLFAAGNQRVENVGAQPENTSTVNTMLKP